jgi:hypothetical protein
LSSLPFDLLDDRRFEILTYRLKCAELDSSGARVHLMQGVGERGRDVLVYNQQGSLVQVIQCKRLQKRMTAPTLRQELIKLALHAFLQRDILGNGPVAYELWCSGGLTEQAASILNRWPNLWTEANVCNDTEEVIGQYARLKTLTWHKVKRFVCTTFPKIVQPELVNDITITSRVRACPQVYQAFFQYNVVMPSDDVEARLRKVLAEGMRIRELNDADARHVLDRLQAFPPEQRLVFTSGYVMGISPDLVGRFNDAEFEQFTKHAISTTFDITKTVVLACDRLAFDVGSECREACIPAHPALAHVFMLVCKTSMLLRIKAIGPLRPQTQSKLQTYFQLDLPGRFSLQSRETWTDYQKCLAGYDHERHPPGSDEEFRSRIAKHALDGALTCDDFEQALMKSFRHHIRELQRRFDAYMVLVPEQILVVTDTQTIFQNEHLRSRMKESMEILEKLRKPPVIPVPKDVLYRGQPKRSS